MTDVFGVAGTGLEYIPPRQIMTRLSYKFWFIINNSYNQQIKLILLRITDG
jgi:hypothetical protein